MDQLNHVNLGWILVLILACSVIGAGLGWLLAGRRR